MFQKDKLINTLEHNYFVPLVLFAIEIAAIILAAKNLRNQKIAKYFLFYLLFDLITLTCDIYLYSSNTNNNFRLRFVIATNNLIGLCELQVYYKFFSAIILVKNWYRFLNATRIVIFTISIPLTIFIIILPLKTIEYPTNLFGAVQLLLLIPPCIKYFHNILSTESTLSLLSRPSFFITSGVFFYSASSIPFYLIKKVLDNLHSNYELDIAAAFFYTPIVINLIFLTIAFKWGKTITI